MQVQALRHCVTLCQAGKRKSTVRELPRDLAVTGYGRMECPTTGTAFGQCHKHVPYCVVYKLYIKNHVKMYQIDELLDSCHILGKFE